MIAIDYNEKLMLLSRTNQALSQSVIPGQMPRLGLINYINSLPFVLPIVQGHVKVNAQIFLKEPAGLNALYASQELELGMISLFSFLKLANLTLMPGISIASRGPVGSVLFFSKLTLDSQKPLRIAVPAASATAVNLLLLLLLEHTGQKPLLFVAENPDISNPAVDAALIIGDRALLVDEEWSKHYQRHDLGQWWHDTYKLPAVFAVFAARQIWHDESAETVRSANTNNGHQHKYLGEQINASLISAASLGLTDYFPLVLNEAQSKTGLPVSRLMQYFNQELDYSLSAEHITAVKKYELLCRQYDLFR